MSNMPPAVRKGWAKEVLLSVIDDYLKDGFIILEGSDFIDRRALEKERDRIAKFFKLPTKY